MNLAAIHVCEHAALDSGKRLSMLNAFTEVTGSAPANLPRACVVMVFTFGRAERGASRRVRVEFLARNREAFLPPVEATLQVPDGELPEGMPYRHIQTININGLVLQTHGVLSVEVYVDDIFLGSEQFVFLASGS